MKRPFLLAGARVERHHIAGRVAHRAWHEALFERRRNDDRVAIDHGRRAVADARDVVEVDVQLLHQIDSPVDTELSDRHSGLGVERDQIEAGGDDKNPFFASVRPIADAAACVSAGRLTVATVFVHAVQSHNCFPVAASMAATTR
jgi:hypothetical protein